MTHLVPLGERWRIWNWSILRGAGLPVTTLSRLAYPAAAETFADATTHLGEQLRAIGHDPLFREALTWQNRHALHTGVDVLLARPAEAPRTSKYRQKEALIASYLQRYCARNDSIGFFGPVGWARTDGDTGILTFRAGPALIASRTTHLEGWAVDRVAALDRTDALPRLMPYLRLDGGLLHIPLTRPVELPAETAAVLALCDGRHTPGAISDATGLPSHTVGGILASLHHARRISWAPAAPGGLYPERGLRGPHVDCLRAHRDAIAAAAGDEARLDRAFEELEEWFVDVTRTSATRRAGQAYAGRTVVYEDCQRDVELTLGPLLRAELAGPLDLLLTSARWLTGHALEQYRQILDGLYGRLTARTGHEVVPFPELWLYAQDLLFGDSAELLDELAAECQRRWATVLGERPSGQYRSDDLREAVRAAFPDPGRLPPATRYCCPDIMIAARDIAAIDAGNHQYVLGELHAGINTMASSFFVGQHPCPDELMRAADIDVPEATVVAVMSRAGPGVTARMTRSLIRERDRLLLFAHDSPDVQPDRALPAGSLAVTTASGRLQVIERDGQQRFDLMDVLGELIMVRAHRSFGLLSAQAHAPRVSIDRLIVSRERWRVEAANAAFAWDADEEQRYRAARRWARDLGMPRYVFVQPSPAVKPVYVDFDSPVFIDVLSRIVRRSGALSVTEMMPAPDECWLTDAAGQHYTSELRLVAISASGAAA
jgi:hypothetical protein